MINDEDMGGGGMVGGDIGVGGGKGGGNEEDYGDMGPGPSV